MFDIVNRASELAISSMTEAFVLIDANNNLLDANESARNLFESLKFVRKNTPTNQIHGWPVELNITKGKKCGKVQFSMHGDKFYIANISPVLAENRKLLGYVILMQDITESVMFTKKLEEMAYTDSLTGIPNRSNFTNLALTQFNRIKRSRGSSFVIMLDIDHFKNVNDTYGHPFGDKVLICVAERVKHTLRPYDLFGRYGGEEFILYITEVNEKSIMDLAERVRLAICNAPMDIEGIKLNVSASFGVSPVALDNDTLDAAIQLADDALYRAKNEGRNRVVMLFEPLEKLG
jgi:diguanylate cyclase (GGDEF)-like protein